MPDQDQSTKLLEPLPLQGEIRKGGVADNAVVANAWLSGSMESPQVVTDGTGQNEASPQQALAPPAPSTPNAPAATASEE